MHRSDRVIGADARLLSNAAVLGRIVELQAAEIKRSELSADAILDEIRPSRYRTSERFSTTRAASAHQAAAAGLAIYCEDDEDELHRRQAAINRHYDCDFRDLEAFSE